MLGHFACKLNLIYLIAFVTNCTKSSSLTQTHHQCISNCTSVCRGVGDEKGTLNPIVCSIDREECNNDQLHGPANLPKILSEGFYTYEDPIDHHVKIALNFSWAPSHDSSIERLRGYRIIIVKPTPIVYSNEELFYCFDTNLTFYKHVLGSFYYDCYGLSASSHIAPGDELVVHINSIPYPFPYSELDGNFLKVKISIPDCDDQRVHAVRECVVRRSFQISVAKVFCSNQTIQYTYNVPTEYGSVARFLLCESGDGESCKNSWESWNRSVLNSTDWVSSLNWRKNYTLSIWGSDGSEMRAITHISFVDCFTEQQDVLAILTQLLPFFIVVVVIAVVTAVMIKFRHRCRRVNIAEKIHEYHSKSTKPSITPTKIVSVYIIFVDDHPEHKKIVEIFANYLQSDLGFEVIFELWDEIKLYADAAGWMQESMARADKIIVIWSPGVSDRLRCYGESQDSKPDLFSPVFKEISDNMFSRKNLGKYFLAYFSYCTYDNDVHANFGRFTRSFKLMDQFNELYFRLINKEKHVPGGICRVDKVDQYDDPQTTTNGPILSKAIAKMCELTSMHPDWFSDTTPYRDEHVNGTLPLGDTESIERNIIPVIPPTELPMLDDESGVSRTFEDDYGDTTPCQEEMLELLAGDYPFQQDSVMHAMGHSSSLQGPGESGFVSESASTSNSFPFQKRPVPIVQCVPIDPTCDPEQTLLEINQLSLK